MNKRPLLPKATVQRVEAMLASAKTVGLKMTAIARECGVAVGTVSTIRRGQHFHQQAVDEQRRRLGQDAEGLARAAANRGHYLPSPEEIRAACLQIHEDDRRRGIVRPEDRDKAPVHFLPVELLVG